MTKKMKEVFRPSQVKDLYESINQTLFLEDAHVVNFHGRWEARCVYAL